MKRIAAPMVGGVISSTILELIIYPAIYMIWRSREFTKDKYPLLSNNNEAAPEAYCKRVTFRVSAGDLRGGIPPPLRDTLF